MWKIFWSKNSANYDWHEKDLNNQDEPSCENCGSHNYQYHCNIQEHEHGDDVEYLICNDCKHIFEASLR